MFLNLVREPCVLFRKNIEHRSTRSRHPKALGRFVGDTLLYAWWELTWPRPLIAWWKSMFQITGWIDKGLNEKAYIIPGLGDFGERRWWTRNYWSHLSMLTLPLGTHAEARKCLMGFIGYAFGGTQVMQRVIQRLSELVVSILSCITIQRTTVISMQLFQFKKYNGSIWPKSWPKMWAHECPKMACGAYGSSRYLISSSVNLTSTAAEL